MDQRCADMNAHGQHGAARIHCCRYLQLCVYGRDTDTGPRRIRIVRSGITDMADKSLHEIGRETITLQDK